MLLTTMLLSCTIQDRNMNYPSRQEVPQNTIDSSTPANIEIFN